VRAAAAVRTRPGRDGSDPMRTSSTIVIAINRPSPFQYVSGWSRRAPALNERFAGTTDGSSRVASA
jgi:hypothetical protein